MLHLGPILIILAAVLWAFDGVLRVSLYSLPPITIVFAEHLLGSLIILPFAAHSLTKLRLSSRDWLALTWVAILSGFLGTLWFTTALTKTNFIPFSVVFLLQKLQPLFAITAARLVLKETLPPRFLFWAALALIAAYFVTFPNGQVSLSNQPGNISAALFALGAAFAWGSSTAFSRLLLKNHPHTQITALRFIATTLITLPLVFLFGHANSLTSISTDQVVRLLAIACSTGLFALWIYYQGLKRTQAKISTLLELAFPLTAVFIDRLLYQTTLVPSQYLAAIVLFFAIIMLTKENQSARPKHTT